MTASVEQRVTATVVVVTAVSVAAYQGASVFAPLVLALFIIAVVWPLQQWLQPRLPKLSRSRSLLSLPSRCVLLLHRLRCGDWSGGALARRRFARYQALYNDVETWLTVTASRSRGSGPSISMSAGCCGRRNRSPVVSALRCDFPAHRARLRHSRSSGDRRYSSQDRGARQSQRGARLAGR